MFGEVGSAPIFPVAKVRFRPKADIFVSLGQGDFEMDSQLEGATADAHIAARLLAQFLRSDGLNG
ncbi:hypothetical protein HY57_01425 [Dyella japonica A8]|uniref:Uncharacterized protein n=1 Tax=Dyella japonica A8 TaxID=1217721 RepID=A0A075JWU9_9GAMM|nr:hypothetical protein HY57_01425 [Dyella japonica A8]